MFDKLYNIEIPIEKIVLNSVNLVKDETIIRGGLGGKLIYPMFPKANVSITFNTGKVKIYKNVDSIAIDKNNLYIYFKVRYLCLADDLLNRKSFYYNINTNIIGGIIFYVYEHELPYTISMEEFILRLSARNIPLEIRHNNNDRLLIARLDTVDYKKIATL